VLSFSARLRFLAGDLNEALEIAREALALAEELQLDELRAHTLTTIGSAKNRLEPSSGHAELAQALDIAVAVNSPQVSTILNNLAVEAGASGERRRASELYSEGIRAAERFGDRDGARFNRANLLYSDFFTGRWNEVYANADQFIAECETSPHYMEGAALAVRAYIRHARGDQPGALADWARTLALSREAKDPQRLLPALLQAARGYAVLGREAEARKLAAEALDEVRGHPDLGEYFGQITGVAKQLGLRDQIFELVAQAPETGWQRAALAAAQGDFVTAADSYAELGATAIEADARYSAAIELIESGSGAEGVEQLERALAFYRSVGATFYIERGEALLASAQSASA
jgi:tetratricopeptide (TPR) repeat protein